MSGLNKVLEDVGQLLKPTGKKVKRIRKRKNPKNSDQVVPQSSNSTDGIPPNRSRSFNARGSRAPRNVPVNFQIEHSMGKLAITACITERSIHWIHYSLDPHGYKESGLYKGDALPTIPDGLLVKGLAAEIRQVDRISAPGTNNSEISLNGQMWNLVMIKFAGFRTNTIMLASVNNEDVNDVVIEAFKQIIRRFVYPPGYVGGQWIPLGIDGWFWRIQFYVPQAKLPEPVDGVSRTVDKYRLLVKASTIYFNAPSLLNQGIDFGGSFQRSGEARVHVIPEFDNKTPFLLNVLFVTGANPPRAGQLFVGSPFPIPGIVGTIFNWNNASSDVSTVPGTIGTLVNGIAVNGVVLAPPGNRIYWRTVFTPAIPGQTLNVVRLELVTDEGAGTDPIILYAAPDTPFSYVGLNYSVPLEYVISDAESDFEIHGNTTYDIPLPPLSMNDIAVNDPNYLIGLPRRDDGIYIVQQKFANLRDWQFAEASSFSGINFTTASGINNETAYINGGIRDVADKNLNIAVLLFQGISQTAQVVDTTTMAWEGQASADSALGQFQHEGSETCIAALEFYNSFVANTKGIYPARSNFLGNICKMITGFLRTTLLSNATPDYMSRAGSEMGKYAHEQLTKYLTKV